MRKILILILLILLIPAGGALADFTFTQGVGSTAFDFTCVTTKHCFGSVLIDSTGTEKATVANPIVIGANVAGSATAIEICGSAAHVFVNTATDTQLVAISGTKNIHVCDWEFSASAGEDNHLESATAASCGGTLTGLGNTYYAVTPAKAAPNRIYSGLNTGAGNALCVHTTSTSNYDITVYYNQN